MCGIAGAASFGGAPPPDEHLVRAMCATIVHRGPDDEGIGVFGPVAMGMRRLSIIDLAGGHQPIFNEDRSVAVVFNGEIYNFRELRADLEARGHRFATRSDTEAIVHAYEEFGLDFPARLNGMFAFSVYDIPRRRLVLARDHAGIKPLYYAFGPGGLVWGSEIKALLASGRVARELDVEALGEFLTWEYVPAPRTLLKGVRKLEPASMLVVDLDHPADAPRAYWDIPLADPAAAGSGDDWADELDARLRACVQRQLVSDVPLGAFLSGGVDSSLVVAGMGPARTFSIGFADPTYNELPWSERVARHLGTDHATEVLDPDILDLFTRLVPHLDDPIGDFSIFPTYLVSALARRSVTVTLSGDGGDELFGGYETYVADAWARRLFAGPAGRLAGRALAGALARVPPRPAKKGTINKAKRFTEGLRHDPALGHARWRRFLTGAECTALLAPDVRRLVPDPGGRHIQRWFERAGPRDPLSRSLYVDFKTYLADDILPKVDRMSMAVSLESRVPFLDPELIELAFRVPAGLKLRGGQTKAILKQVAARHVPPACVYRPKEGFSIPIKHWLNTTLRPLADETFDPARLRDQGLFDPAAVGRLAAEHRAGRANHSHILWALIVFGQWQQAWGVSR